MLILSLRKREQIELCTPSGTVDIYCFGDGAIGIDAPKAWPINRIALPDVTRGAPPEPAAAGASELSDA